MPQSAIDPTLDYLRPRFQAEFKTAFEHAIRSLAPRERVLLKHHFLDGLSMDDLAVLYQVHRTTTFRWFTRARQRLLSRTRQALAAQLSLSRSELDSLMQLIDSQLDVSAVRLLGAAESAQD
jgi:RNA polymerase sigma-70 factor (ECF subfamily)